MTNLTSFLQFFFRFQSQVIGYFLLWLTSHGHGFSKWGPKTVTGLDLKALVIGPSICRLVVELAMVQFPHIIAGGKPVSHVTMQNFTLPHHSLWTPSSFLESLWIPSSIPFVPRSLGVVLSCPVLFLVYSQFRNTAMLYTILTTFYLSLCNRQCMAHTRLGD